jgi:hypothetical protein
MPTCGLAGIAQGLANRPVFAAPWLRRATTITHLTLFSIGAGQTLSSCEPRRSQKHPATRQVETRSSDAKGMLETLKTSSGRRRPASPLVLSAA